MKAVNPYRLMQIINEHRRGHCLIVDESFSTKINAMLKDTYDIPAYRINSIDKYIERIESYITKVKETEIGETRGLSNLQLASILEISRPTLKKWSDAGIIHCRTVEQDVNDWNREHPHLRFSIDKRLRTTNRKVGNYDLKIVLDDLRRYKNFTS